MLAEYIKLTRKNPITGRSRRGQRDIQYAVVDEVVFRITHFHSGPQPVLIEFADEHLTAAGLRVWSSSWHRRFHRTDSLDAARTWMAEFFRSQESAELLAHDEQAVETWQMLDVGSARVPAPYRIVELHHDHYLAVANDPRPLLWSHTNLAWEDGTPRVGGSPVLAEANRHSPSLDGAVYTGWIVSADGGRSYSDPIPRKVDALAYLRVIADQNVPSDRTNR
ncbi:hypothetical protein OG413_43565 [Streptomyces sp. NBC_01433]|uniref:hypothetical protein n=1 Tax=Streptomyces sp. NBC_01433 TaxID=2903864 RepID=UPI0022544C70|nr:hypothetical protein [Streptomyces sp. NBC_01433]MCX4682063.1 hypothetical protein [Streptomyces sp. NBC_01433]